jgi:hypothetical protein
MDGLQDAFFHVSQTMYRQLLASPAPRAVVPEPIGNLIDRLNMVRRRYEPSSGQQELSFPRQDQF